MNCAISVVIIGWDGYFFHDEIVADRYLSLRQAERRMCLCYAIRDVAKLTGKGISTIQRVKKEFC